MRFLGLGPRAPITVATLAFALALGVAPGCAPPNEETTPNGEGHLTTNVLPGKKAFFDEELLFVRVKGWDGDPDALRDQRDEARLGDAEIEIHEARPDSREHCPTASDSTLVYRSKAFTLRTSGNMTNGTPKSSFKIALEDKEDRLFGMKTLNLKSMWNDVSQMREGLAWRLFREARVVASQHTYAKLCVDGRKDGQPFTKYMGLYSVIEQVDKAMLKDHFGKKNDGGNLYKADWPKADLGPATLAHRSRGGDDSGKQYKVEADNDARTYQQKTNDDADDPGELQTYDDLATLVRVVNGVTLGDARDAFASPAYATAVEEVLNAKAFLRWAALNALVGGWDNYWASPTNYYLYNSGKRDGGDAFMAKPYFTWIPWDYDNAFGVHFTNARWAEASIVDFTTYDGRTSNMENLPLLRHMLENPAFLAYYLDAIEHLNETLFTVEHVSGILGALRARIERAAFLEGEGSAPAHTGRQFTNDEVFRYGLEHHELRRDATFILGIEHFVRIRHDHVTRELATLRAARGIARGASGASFPATPEPLP